MRTALFIRTAVAISAQQSFEPEHFLKPIQTSNNGMLYALDVPYQNYIPPVPIRRMSRVLKMAISAAIEALRQAGIEQPDAILTGTGRGSVTDMQGFVRDLIVLEEGAMNPTLFIQSTYNSPIGWIAMLTGCRAYNQTFVHRGCSFELALIDAQLCAAEAEKPMSLLVGSYEELTEDYVKIRGKRGYWKQPATLSLDILKHSDTPGSLAGEGAAFFLLTTEASGASAIINGVEIIYFADPDKVRDAVCRVLNEAGLNASDIALVITGQSGDCVRDKLYGPSLQLFPEKPVAAFKPLCGEFETAGSFGLWLANFMLKSDKLPSDLFLYNPVTRVHGPTLVINDFIQGPASVMLLSPCH